MSDGMEDDHEEIRRAPIQFLGEPDLPAEKRLRVELRGLRSWATSTQRLDLITDLLIQGLPELAGGFLERASPRDKIKETLGQRLLDVEAHFVEKRWRLPQWRRPPWLLDKFSDLRI